MVVVFCGGSDGSGSDSGSGIVVVVLVVGKNRLFLN